MKTVTTTRPRSTSPVLVDQIFDAGHGVNGGHGYTKLVIINRYGHQLDPVVFPSQIAEAGSQQVQGATRQPARIEAGGSSWWVGEDAQLADTQLTMHTAERLDDAAFIPALVRSAYERVGLLDDHTGSVCVSCLPATWAASRERCAALGARIRAGAPLTFERLRIIPEPVALLYSLLFDDDGQEVGDPHLNGQVGVIDAGQVTLDLAVVRRRLPIEDRLATSADLGMAAALNKVRARLSGALDVDLSLYEVDQAIRTSSVRMFGEGVRLPDGWDRPLITHANAMAAWIGEAWRGGAKLDAIVLGGGGAELEIVADRVRRLFRHLQVVERPQIAVALGCARYARALAAAAHVVHR